MAQGIRTSALVPIQQTDRDIKPERGAEELVHDAQLHTGPVLEPAPDRHRDEVDQRRACGEHHGLIDRREGGQHQAAQCIGPECWDQRPAPCFAIIPPLLDEELPRAAPRKLSAGEVDLGFWSAGRQEGTDAFDEGKGDLRRPMAPEPLVDGVPLERLREGAE